MTVNETVRRLNKAIAAGHGELDLIAKCGSDGVSYETRVWSGTTQVENPASEAGELCEKEKGYEYVPIFLGS